MSTLVTGATGFVGSAVTRQLLARGHAVRVLARPGGDRRNIAGLPVEIAEGDLRDPEACRRALVGIKDLFHVAADYRLWVRDPAAMYATNIDATIALIRRRRTAASRASFTSSVATPVRAGRNTPSDETTPVAADEMITHTNAQSGREAMCAGCARGSLPIVIVNPSTRLPARRSADTDGRT
jgi:dihydroflavonol-4-reductase